MTPEEQVTSLLDFLKERSDGGVSIENLPSSNEEWAEWFTRAVEQGVAPLLYFRITRRAMRAKIPSHILDQLQGAYHQNAARNMLLSSEIEKIVGILNEHEIPVLVLKGAFLAFNIYRNPALRTMSDLDILVPSNRIHATINILLETGYYRKNPAWLESAYHLELLPPHNERHSLEVHWELTDAVLDRIFPIAKIWERALPFKNTWGNFNTMAAEDLLIYLCQHASVRHLFTQGTRALCDIDTVIRYYGSALDWETVRLRANAWNLSRAIGLTLHLCNEYLGTPIVEPAIKQFGLRQIDPNILQETMRQLSSAIVDSNTILPANIVKILNQEKPTSFISHFFVNIFRPFLIPLPGVSQPMKLYFSFRRLLYLVNKYLGEVQVLLRHNVFVSQQLKRQRSLLKWLLM